MIRALTFCWEFPPHISGGLGTACDGMIQGLLNNNIDVLCVLPKMNADANDIGIKFIDASKMVLTGDRAFSNQFCQANVVEIESLLMPYQTFEEYKILSEKIKLENSLFHNPQQNSFNGGYGENLISEIFRYAIVAEEVSQKFDFDIIHAHDWMTFPAALAAKKIKNKPLIVHVHSTEFDRSGQNIQQEIYDIEYKGLQSSDRIMAVSQYTKNMLVNHYDVSPEKISIIHNSVLPFSSDNKKFTKWLDYQIVTFLGRITWQKGPEHFIEAALQVLRYNKNVRFIMAGSGDLLNRMIQKVAFLRLGQYFHFTGFLKKEEVHELLAITDIYVMPSTSEPFGITPLEAMGLGVPTIISKQSGVAEVLNHAIKIDFWDNDALADAINAILNSKTLSNMMKKNGKEELKTMTWDKQAAKIETIYHTLTTQ